MSLEKLFSTSGIFFTFFLGGISLELLQKTNSTKDQHLQKTNSTKYQGLQKTNATKDQQLQKGRFFKSKVVPGSKLFRYVANTDFGQTVGRNFKIQPVDKVIQERNFGFEFCPCVLIAILDIIKIGRFFL